MAALLQDEPAIRVTDGLARGTLALTVTIASPALKKPIVYRNLYAAEGDVVTLASGQAGRLAAILLQNGVRRVPIASVTVTERIQTRVRAARILGARIAPRRVTAGGRATLLLRSSRGGRPRARSGCRSASPRSVGPGPSAIRVIPKSEGGFDPLPADLAQQLGLGGGVAPRTAAVRRAEVLATRATGTPLQRIIRGLERATDDRNDAIRLVGVDDDDTDPRAAPPPPCRS